MGTTKLTRKEILAEDPVHEALVYMIEFLKAHANKIAILVGTIALAAFGVYSGLRFLDKREVQAQQQLAKALEFFHAEVSSDALDDPYAKGYMPIFRNEDAKYQAAAKEFSSIVSGYGYSKVAKIAQYYLGLVQLRLGQDKEAIQNIESVAGSSRNRTATYLAQRLLAVHSFDAGNYQRAREILESMIKDAQCDLPKEELSVQLSRVLMAQGKREEAIKILQEADSQGSASSMLNSQVKKELEKLQKAPGATAESSSIRP